MRYFRNSALVLVAMSGLDSARAFADDKGAFKLDPAEVQVGTSDSKLKATALYDSDGPNFNGWLAGLTLKLPTSDTEGHAETRLDEFTADWRAGLSLGREIALGALARDKFRLQLEPEWGFKEFKYFPSPPSVTTSSSVKHSFALGGNVLLYHEPETFGPMAFQVKLRIARDWEDSKAFGIVTPASGTLPAMVKDSKIINGPVGQASITARAFYWQRLGMGSAWALGPSAAVTAAGDKGHDFSPRATIVVRSELWLYFLPSSASPANLRLGIAPFLSGYLTGEAPDHRTVVPGALFQVRYGAPVFVY